MQPAGRKKSAVWQHFKVIPEEKEKTQCQLCSDKITYRDSNTTGMKRHLERRHGIIESEESCPKKPCNQSTIQECVQKTQPLDRSSRKYRSLMESIIFMIAKDIQPFDIVNNEGFRQVLKVAEPR